MLQDSTAISHYHKLTDALTELQRRGYRFPELRLYIEGYTAGLHYAGTLAPHQAYRLEEEALRFLRDPANFEIPDPEVQSDA
ncbi:MAG: hypothetical protein BRC58_06250 [Cyanobacteria bacterium QS_8_64_29]|nr:MAG: hypothetical protein BRC58_06250 [Cyanobacteria bacterium QS_8_64_29]